MPSSRWSRRKDRDGADRGSDGGARAEKRAASDDDSVDLDDGADAWWTGRGETADDASGVKSHTGPRTADEIREAFKRKRKRPEPAAKPHGAFSEYYSADSLFTSVDEGDTDLFDPEDPYVVLGVPTSATWEQVTSAHRRLAKIHHPDRLLSADDEERVKSEQRMAEINIAYAELRKRRGI